MGCSAFTLLQPGRIKSTSAPKRDGLFAAMKFQAEMGMLMGLLMVFNMVGALVFIPALTGILKPRFVLGQKGREVIA